MPKHKILCTICKDVLKNTDDICSTDCGHVFHLVCMSESKSQSTCPECQHNNPTTHKIYLCFDECKHENLANNWKDKMKIIELHKQIEDNKSDYLHLQEKYVMTQDCVRRLEGRIKKSDHSTAQRSVILSDLEDRIKTLEELNQYLTIDNECKSEALISKANEIKSLNKLVATLGEDNNACATVLNEQIRSNLEQKLNDQSIQLAREVAKCSELARDKENLQKFIDLLKSSEKNDLKLDNSDNVNEPYSTEKIITNGPGELNSLKSCHQVAEEIADITDRNSSPRIYTRDVVPSFTGYGIINGNPLNNYFCKLFIKDQQQTKKAIIRTAKCTSCTKLKLIFRKLRNKCLVRSTVLIFLFLMSNVTSVY